MNKIHLFYIFSTLLMIGLIVAGIVLSGFAGGVLVGIGVLGLYVDYWAYRRVKRIVGG